MKKIFFIMLALISLSISANALCYNPSENIEEDGYNCYKVNEFEELMNIERNFQLPLGSEYNNSLALSTLITYNLVKNNLKILNLTKEPEDFLNGRINITNNAVIPDINNSSRTIFKYMKDKILSNTPVAFLDKHNDIIIVYKFDDKYFYYFYSRGKTVSYIKESEFLNFIADKRYFRLETNISIK